MKRFLVVLLVTLFSISLFGCAKKQSEEAQEPMTMDAMSTVNITTPPMPPAPEAKAPIMPASAAASGAVALPPSGPFSPSNMEIQTALKAAGLYAGEIDGKIGPKTKKAIEEFQKANNLKVDGKVGPRTWEALKVYLNPAPATTGKR